MKTPAPFKQPLPLHRDLTHNAFIWYSSVGCYPSTNEFWLWLSPVGGETKWKSSPFHCWAAFTTSFLHWWWQYRDVWLGKDMLICLTLLLIDTGSHPLASPQLWGAFYSTGIRFGNCPPDIEHLVYPSPTPHPPLHSPPPTNVLLYPSLFSATFQTAAILDLVLGKALNIMWVRNYQTLKTAK